LTKREISRWLDKDHPYQYAKGATIGDIPVTRFSKRELVKIVDFLGTRLFYLEAKDDNKN